MQQSQYASRMDTRQIWTWNATVPEAMDGLVHGLFVEKANEAPDALAVDAWDARFTYSELDRATTRLASHLVHVSRVEPGMMVPICFEKSAWAIVAMLSVLKAGAAFVPLDPAQPALRRAKVLRQLGDRAKVAIASVLHAKTLEEDGRTIIVVGPSELGHLREEALPPISVGADCAAYCLFTSGSTGEPKGVVMEHGAIVSSQVRRRDFKGYNKDSRVFQFSSYTFDPCIDEIFMTLGVGGCICVPSEEDRMNRLASTINKMSVNLLEVTTTVAGLISPDEVPLVKTIIFGGEFLSHAACAPWEGKARVINSYGPTECCVDCVFTDFTTRSTPGLIGTSAASVTWVVDPDDHNHLTPIGLTGELLIEGPVLARAYLNSPEKTAEAFVQDPEWLICGVDDRPGRQGRLYKTGDLVKYTTDGKLLYVGRKDTQVKIHGQRVELEEIESQILEYVPHGSGVIAEVVSYGDGTEALVAFIRSSSEKTSSEFYGNSDAPISLEPMANSTSLQRNLSKALPGYMVPAVFFSSRAFPMTTSGKIDRKFLREAASQRGMVHNTGETALRPISSREQKLQQIFADILKVEKSKISVNDSFFELGGTSVAAIKLAGQARKQGMKLAVADIFQHPRLCDLAAKASSKPSKKKDISVAPFSLLGSPEEGRLVRDRTAESYNLEPDAIEDLFPCTPLQEGMLSLTSRDTGSEYMIQRVLHISPNMDIGRFRSAWETVVEQLPALRTRIFLADDGGNLLQSYVKDAVHWKQANDLDEYLRCDRAIPMELGDRLVRYAIVEEGQERYFVWTIHHCIYDGWTMPRMIALVERAYAQEALSIGNQANFNAFVKGFLSRNVDEARKFWTSYLSGSEATKLPNRVYKPDSADSRGFAECRRPLPLSRSKNHVPTTIIRAAMGIVLSQRTGSDDIVFGTVVSGRQAAIDDIQDIMGPTLATVPVRLRIDSNMTKGQFLDSVQNDAIAMVPYEQEGIQSIAGFDSSCRDACNFQMYLAVQQDDPDSFDSGALGQWQSELGRPNGVSTYPIMVECYLEGDGLNIQATFDQETVSSSEMDRIINHFIYVLEQLLQGDLSHRLADVEPVSPHDLQRILAWNDTVPVLVEETLHDISLRKTRETPDAMAVDAWDGRLTYSELDLATSHVANLLVQAGVGPEIMVPICFEKSIWAVVTMLAVLKAGGAFVPLDPKQPKLRRETVLKQIPCPVMVASAANAGLLEADGRAVMVVGPSMLNIQRLRSDPGHGSNVLKNISPDTAAYILFTSGSTGEPKGVVIQHQAITSSLLSRAEGQGYGPQTRILQFASYTFDAMVDEIFMTLACGGCICIPSDDDAMSDLNGSIRDFGVNSLALTATILRLIGPEEVPDVDSVIFWGEAVSQQDLKRWTRVPRRRTPRIQVRYGPTECCVTCTHYEVDLDRLPRGNPIGKAVGSRAWVVDSNNHDELVPIGGIGELLMEGPAQARWYLNDQARTDAAFIYDPNFLIHNSRLDQIQAGKRRLYKTGDLVRYDDDGNLIYMGRKDAQVKLNGQRVELGEIESHIANCISGASQVLADIVTLEGGKRVLAAFVKFDTDDKTTPTEGQLAKALPTADKLEIENKMSQRVPRHMIPTLFFAIQRVPHTLTGKLDRRLLRDEAKRAGLQGNQQEKDEKATSIPMTEREKKMQQVWSKILNLELSAIHVDDTFFQLGGHSVTAMKVAAEARKHKMSVTVADIFQNPRLRDLAAVARSSTMNQQDATITPFSLLPNPSESLNLCREIEAVHGLEQNAIEDLLPCTPLQEGLLSLTSGDTGDYVAQRVLRISDDISLDRLRDAWEVVVRALPILRTRLFFTKDHGILQGVLRRGIEWTHAESLEDYLQSDMAKSTGIGEPLSRYAIINGQSGQGRWLVWTMHHSLYDAWTLPRILEMVERAYRGMSLGKHVSFSVFIKYFMNRDKQKTRQFWQDYLSGAGRLRLVKHGETTEPPSRGFLQSERATKFNSDHHVPATFVHAAVGIVLSQLSGGVNDVTFASTVFGRACPVDGIENVMGPTIATVPVRVQFQHGQTVKDLLERLQNHAASMVPHEQEGIQNIRRMSQSCRDACEFQAYLVVKQDDPAYPDEPGSGMFGEWQEGPEQSELTTYPIMMECRVHDEGFKVRMSVSTEVASLEGMGLLMDRFHSVLEKLLQSSSASTLQEVISTPTSGLKPVWERDLEHDPLNGNARVQPGFGDILHSRPNGQPPPVTNDILRPAGRPAEILHRIWAEALGLDPWTFSINDNLFHLGGDSIAAMKVAAAARTYGCKITVSNLLRFPTISKQLSHFSISSREETSANNGHVSGSAEKLQHIWASALGLKPTAISVEDNLFHLGGDSVVAMKIAANARASGWSIAVSDILKFPTISQQLPYFSARKALEPVLAVPRPYSLIPSGLKEEVLERLGKEGFRNDVLDILPTTDFQSMTVTDNIKAPWTARNFFSLDLGSSVDSENLQDACNALVSHLEVLRTVFVCARGKTWQVVLRSLPVALTTITATNEDPAELHNKINEIAQKNSSFDHPVVSFTLAHTPSVGYKLIIGISHAQYDGLSVPLILRVLESAYNKTPVPISTPFSAYLNLQDKRRSSSRAYWRTLLKSSSLTQGLPRLSADLSPNVQPRRIEAGGMIKLAEAIPEGFTLAVVANLSWALLLHTATGNDDIVYVTLASGRSHPVRGIEGVVGPCITLVPVRLIFSKLWAASELATSVQEQFLALDQGDTMGIDEIRAQCTDWPAQPASDSVFFHQGVSDSPEHNLAGAPVKAQLYLNPAVEIKRTIVTTTQLDEGLAVKVQSSSTLMTEKDAFALVDAFSAAFSIVCRNL
ncbi:hypothetical protein KVR01_012818 [Diaporthe batatas]|uniref:uncharacterized protein n=1 Tax=Diaporthe batatas TaxID=748121 RepID=UPI001D03AA9F|nr:uncharacterized protein KVR01_012818 [Diaporthe batatas]KAG8157434.1 hypothetical protein KVR01_012818 [Diaporthe batatas]